MPNFNSHIFSAVCGRSREDAIKIVQNAVGFEADSPLLDLIPTAREWERMSAGKRLQVIGDWLCAECYRLGDDNDNPARFVTVSDPIDTVGTRD